MEVGRWRWDDGGGMMEVGAAWERGQPTGQQRAASSQRPAASSQQPAASSQRGGLGAFRRLLGSSGGVG